LIENERILSKSQAQLSANQHRAIAALLSESSICDAAKAAKISEPTLFRWLKDEAFNTAYMKARRQATMQAIAQLQQSSSKAVKALCDIMEDKEAPTSSRVSAAKTILELSIKSVEIEDLAQRVVQLESLYVGLGK
jgi:hypothetical protein